MARLRAALWYYSNLSRATQTRKMYHAANRDKIRVHQKRWVTTNRERIRVWQKSWKQERRKNDAEFKLRGNLGSRIKAALKHGKGKQRTATESFIGCTIPALRAHLESLFKPGMTWKNHGLCGWHIDHRAPCVAFDLTDPVEQKMCFNWRNLRPAWAADNLAKNDAITPDAVEAIHSICANFEEINGCGLAA